MCLSVLYAMGNCCRNVVENVLQVKKEAMVTASGKFDNEQLWPFDLFWTFLLALVELSDWVGGKEA